jgi:peptidoglycan/xylan/chitin deacetylase (PgdA/CDA1 family)
MQGLAKAVRIFLFVCFVVFVLGTIAFFVFIYPRVPKVKILLYHEIVDEKNPAAPSISTELFKWQLDFLVKHGYKTVFLRDIIEPYRAGKKIPSNLVVLTFDGDGKNFYDSIYPLLKEYGVEAQLFVITSTIDADGITVEHLKEVYDSGLVRIGSHSHKHIPATCLSFSDKLAEKQNSKNIIEKILGAPIKCYAYPYGAFSYETEEAVQQAGYEAAVGTVYPRDKFKRGDILNLRRVPVDHLSSKPLMFRFMLSGYYVPIRALLLRLLNINAPRYEEDCGAYFYR